jgi:hypothetical protein
MTQFPTQSPVLPATDNAGFTNAREVAAFVVAELIKTLGVYLVTMSEVLNPLYMWAIHARAYSLVLGISAGISVVWGVVVLVLFILLRAGFGGIPTIVLKARDAGRVTCVAEIGAFVIVYAVVLAAIMLLNGFFLAQVYAAVGRTFAPLIGFATSAVGAVLVFFLFLSLRRAMIAPAPISRS